MSEEALDKLEPHWAAYDQQSDLAEPAMAEMLRACFQGLTHNQRRLLTLRYADGLRSSEIAERLDMNVEPFIGPSPAPTAAWPIVFKASLVPRERLARMTEARAENDRADRRDALLTWPFAIWKAG